MKIDLKEQDMVARSGRNADILSGAEMVVAALCKEGVRYVWGYPGGAALPVYDALHEQDQVEHILVRHEQAALHAADGSARVTGKVGVALVTSGPGATNAITGIATAYFDSIPLVVIAANVSTGLIGQDAFQECDAAGITRPITKHNFSVRDVTTLAQTIKRAFYIASTGRPGPVLIDIPKDVLLARSRFVYPDRVEIRSYSPPAHGDRRQIDRAVQALQRAKRPFIYAGGGITSAGASQALKQLVELTGYPVTTTLMGLGAFPGADRRFLGMPGMHGTFEANMALQNCDVLLALGTRFDDRVIGNPADFAKVGRTIIHVDVDPTSISKRVKVDIPIVGDLRHVIPELLARLGSAARGEDLAPWWLNIALWRDRKCLAYDNSVAWLRPQYVIERLCELAGGNTIICSDVGQHQMWAAQYYRFDKPRRWINSGGLGTMGVGLPYAMGAKLASPDSDVVVVTGDGSIQMCIQELSTCLQYGINVKVLCLNNGALGMVRQLQHVDHEGRYVHSYMDSLPDFVKLAQAYGHVGLRVQSQADLDETLLDMLATRDRTVFVDVVVDARERVWPMIPSGKGLTEMLLNTDDIRGE